MPDLETGADECYQLRVEGFQGDRFARAARAPLAAHPAERLTRSAADL